MTENIHLTPLSNRGLGRQVRIVAFMQNPYFEPGTEQRIIDRYTIDQEFHQRILCQSMSGKRLFKAFAGNFKKIWWDNANPKPCFEADGCQPPDYGHIHKILRDKDPDLVITFGRVASDALQQIHDGESTWLCLYCWHPNARGKTQEDLNEFAEKVRKTIQRIAEVIRK